MQNQLEAFIKAHVMFGGLICAAGGAMFKHYWPQAKSWIMTTGTDDLVMKALAEAKIVLKSAGASDDEIKSAEVLFSQIALRASQDVQKDTQQK